MGSSRQKYWSGLLYPSPGDLCDPHIELMSLVSPAWQVDSLPVSLWANLYVACFNVYKCTSSASLPHKLKRNLQLIKMNGKKLQKKEISQIIFLFSKAIKELSVFCL